MLLLLLSLFEKGITNAACCQEEDYHTEKDFACKNNSQCPEINSNKISNTIHKNYIGLTSMLQGFQKCIA